MCIFFFVLFRGFVDRAPNCRKLSPPPTQSLNAPSLLACTPHITMSGYQAPVRDTKPLVNTNSLLLGCTCRTGAGHCFPPSNQSCFGKTAARTATAAKIHMSTATACHIMTGLGVYAVSESCQRKHADHETAQHQITSPPPAKRRQYSLQVQRHITCILSISVDKHTGTHTHTHARHTHTHTRARTHRALAHSHRIVSDKQCCSAGYI